MQYGKFQIILIILFIAVITVVAFGDLYIATDGDDNNPGTIQAPLATLEAARDKIRQVKQSGLPAGPFNVFLREGLYYRAIPFQLDSNDSGTSISPIVYRSYPGESVSLIGGIELPSEWFTPVTSQSPVWDRLDASAQGNVLQCDLLAHGYNNYGKLYKRGFYSDARAAMELFLGDVPLQLARWPNDSFENIVSLPDGQYGHTFTYSGSRTDRWLSAEDPWASGYWYFGWADTYTGIADIDTATKTITLTEDLPYGLKEGARYYVLNLLEEIDSPGEWYINRATGMLYLWPPAEFATQRLIASILHFYTVDGENLSYVFFRGITFEVNRLGLLRIDNGDHIVLSNCTFRNAGTEAIDLDGSDCVIEHCEIYNCGEEGIKLAGGNRYTLQPCNNIVKNCSIHHFARWCRTYRPGILINTVASQILHNEIHDSPHSGILSGSNDNLIAYNRFQHLCQETDDAGVFYAGRDWGQRGNQLLYNLFYDIIGPDDAGSVGVQAVYLDDCLSSYVVFGNIFHNISARAIMVGGGRDNIVENNVIAKAGAAFFTDRRGVVKVNDISGDSWNLLEKIQNFNYTQPPWSTAYPLLADILDEGYDQAKEPKGNQIKKNITFQCTQNLQESCWGGCGGFDFFEITDNLFDVDPMFIDEANDNFALDPASPAYTISGFEPIPFEKIKILAPSDLNEDGVTNIEDLNLLLDHWLSNPAPDPFFADYDLNWDAHCDLLDLAQLFQNWNP